MTFALIITLSWPLTPQVQSLRLDSDQRYTYEKCMFLGAIMEQWLSQDGVVAKAECVPTTVREEAR